MSARTFTGIPFTPKAKCRNCKHLEQCRNRDNSYTAKNILIDCEEFYYIFKKLEEFERLPAFDGNVEKHAEEMLAYEEKHEGVPFLTSPLIVNGALAAELALKSLIFMENAEFECIHNLQRLFEQLPDRHKIPLSEMIYRQAHQDEETLNSNLHRISNLFEVFRYSFEKEAVGYTNFFNEFVHIVCDYAISQKVSDENNN